MPRKTKMTAGDAAALPSIPEGLISQSVSSPMSACGPGALRRWPDAAPVNPRPRRPKQSVRRLAARALFAVLLSIVLPSAWSADFFVAPGGSDTGPGTIAKPFRTIQKCATIAPSGATCYLRAGTYAETVTPNSGITITAYDDEVVTIDGTDRVSGWVPFSGRIYKASVSLPGDDSNQVFVGHEMMTEARWPNGDDLFRPNWAVAQQGTTPATLVDSRLPAANWVGAKVRIWSGEDPWSPLTGTVTSSATGSLALSLDAATNPPYFVPQPGGYYFVFGSLAALDTEREWHHDSAAGMLYFWAPDGVDPNTLDVRAKRRTLAFDLSGRSEVTLRNIRLFACTITTDFASRNVTLDGIAASYVSHYSRLPDNPSNPGNGAWHYTDKSGIVLRGSGHRLINSTIEVSAGNGVVTLGDDMQIENNLIHHVGYMADSTAGVVAWGSRIAIVRNTVHTSGRYLVLPKPFYDRNAEPFTEIDIGYNNLSRAMMLSRDASAIYSGGPPAVRRSRIHHNWVHDNQVLDGPKCPWCDKYTLGGIYVDSNGSGWLIDQNLLWNNQNHSIFINGNPGGWIAGPNNNSVVDNSVIDVSERSYIWFSDIASCGTTQVRNNKVFVPVQQTFSTVGVVCDSANNDASAPGATDSGQRVGCSFEGCALGAPPASAGDRVAASVAVEPRNLARSAGETATLDVVAGGSLPLRYQWRRNGIDIAGAKGPTYTTPPLTVGDDGARYTVRVDNGLGGTESAAGTVRVRPGPADCLFDWAERNYPAQLSPAGTRSLVLAPYYFRHYASSDSYVGVSVADGHVWYLSAGGLSDVGSASAWYTTAGCR